ncbi:zinc ribbon domain-containing protein [Micromonospora chersina]
MDGRERERTYHCEACGLIMDRDRNASLNLAAVPTECRGCRRRAPW